MKDLGAHPVSSVGAGTEASQVWHASFRCGTPAWTAALRCCRYSARTQPRQNMCWQRRATVTGSHTMSLQIVHVRWVRMRLGTCTKTRVPGGGCTAGGVRVDDAQCRAPPLPAKTRMCVVQLRPPPDNQTIRLKPWRFQVSPLAVRLIAEMPEREVVRLGEPGSRMRSSPAPYAPITAMPAEACSPRPQAARSPPPPTWRGSTSPCRHALQNRRPRAWRAGWPAAVSARWARGLALAAGSHRRDGASSGA